MLEAAVAMAPPTLSELNYSTMIPASSPSTPNTFGSRPISHQQDATLVDPVDMLRSPFSLKEHHHGENVNVNDDSYILEFLSASGSLNHIMTMNNTATTTITYLDSVMKKKSKNSKRRRTRTAKTREEAENQRMTHIAVERNRRKQMNERLHLLRSLMPASYLQRGDQASIVGGAIEFVRELEQLLQSLESQKRRRLSVPLSNSQYFGPNTYQISANSGLVEIHEETAGNKSAIADVEVKLVGFNAFIKILTKKRHGQLIKAISGLQDLEFAILHVNVTTIDQTVLYLFNVKIGSKPRLEADDILSSVQQIMTSIPAN